MPSHAGSDRVSESRASLRERQQERRRRRRAVAVRLMLTLVVTTTAAGSAWWWFQHDRVAGAEPEVTFMVAEPGPYQLTVPAPGTLRAASTVEVRTDRSGAVQWVAAIGTRVELDEVVARLEPGEFERDVRDAELALERSERALVASQADLADVDRSLSNALLEAERRVVRAQAALAAAEAKLDLTVRLAAVGGVAPRELSDTEDAYQVAIDELTLAERAVVTANTDIAVRRAKAERDLADAEAALETAQVRLERAQDALEGSVMRSPLAGVVSDVRVASGGFAGTNATLLIISDDRQLELVAQVDESEIAMIQVGQRAMVSAMALGGQRLPSSIMAVAPVARTSQNIPLFEIVLPVENPDGLLRAGMTAEAEVVVRHEEGTITLPSAAVTLNPRGEGIVSVRSDDGEIERVQVEVIAAAGTSMVVRGEFAKGAEIEVPAAASVAALAVTAPAAPASGIIPAITNTTGSPSGGSSGGGGGAGRGGGQ